MTTWIKCGATIDDGDLFCAQCSCAHCLKPQKPVKPQGGKFQKPRQTAASDSAPTDTSAPKRKKLPYILAALLAIFIGISVYFFATVTSQRVALRLREASVHAKEQEYAEMSETVSELESQLQSLQSELSRKNEQIETLTRTVSSAESSASQTEYDMRAQQAEYEELQQAHLALKDDYNTLQEKYDALEASVSDLQKKSKFMDDYVVFVENDGTGYFHKYNCANFARKTFWAYSRKLAESSGFAACPHCMN